MRMLALIFVVLSTLSAAALDITNVDGVTPTIPAGSTPVPDPTKLTQEAVDRAVFQQAALFKVQLDAIIARMDHIQTTLDARPEDVNKAVSSAILSLQELVQQKFTGVDQQFAGRDTALAAALLAQKTAVDEQNRANALSIAKSDAATVKQIDAIGLNVGTITSAINDKIDDLRTRVGSIEGRAVGVNENKSDTASVWNYLFGAIGAVGAVFGIMMVMRQSQHTTRRA